LLGSGIISVQANLEHSTPVFSPDGQEVFRLSNVNRCTRCRRIHQGWRRFATTWYVYPYTGLSRPASRLPGT
jgi:hypothetical protein